MKSLRSFVTCLLLLASPTLAQEPAIAGAAPSVPASSLDRGAIEAQVEELEQLGDEQAGGAQRRQTLAEALRLITKAESARQAGAKYARDAQDAPERATALRDKLAQPVEVEAPKVPADADVRELEAILTAAEATLAAARAEQDEVEQELNRRTSRRQKIVEELAAAQVALAQAVTDLEGAPAEGTPERILAQARVEAAQVELYRLRQEQVYYDASRELYGLRRDELQRRVQRERERSAFWQGKVSVARQQEAEAAAEAAEQRMREAAISDSPELAHLAARNQELAELRSGPDGLTTLIPRQQAALDDLKARLDEVERRSSVVDRRVRVGGLTEGAGALLRRDHEWLPTRAALLRESKELSAAIVEAELLHIQVAEQRTALTAEDATVDGAGDELSAETLAVARELRRDQLSLVDDVLGDLESLLGELYESHEAHERLEVAVERYRVFIEERILWIRSSSLNPFPSLLEVPQHAGEVVGALAQTDWPTVLRTSLGERRGTLVLLLLGWILTIALRPFVKRRRKKVTERVRSFRTDSFDSTLRIFVHCVILAAPGPLLLWIVGWIFFSAPDLVAGFAFACRELAPSYFVLRLVSQIAARGGLAELHFRWPDKAVGTLRREIRWFLPWVITTGVIAHSLARTVETRWADSLGRVALVLSMAGLAVFLLRLTRSINEVVKTPSGSARGLVARTRGLWTAIAVALPLLLIVLALTGYLFTAFEFERRFRMSLGLALAIALFYAFLVRWLFLVRRRLAIEQARQRAKARAEAESVQEESGGASESGSPSRFDEDEVDIPAVDAQTREMFRSSLTLTVVLGLYFIWASALPALRGFDSVQLWPEFAIVEETTSVFSASGAPDLSDPMSILSASTPPSESSSSGSPSTASPSDGANGSLSPSLTSTGTGFPSPAGAAESGSSDGSQASEPFVLTLADLCLAAIFALLTWIAARNVPGLLELSLLQRLPFDSGGRYAVATIVRYLIVIVGASAAFGAIGLGWNKVQWLVAAMTFGLAFGLQEIFANFVSGLIILLERPVRVGDIVTVGGVEGRITRLRMRATTVLDWDRRELLIPNKEFITGSVINWTLSDPVTRLVLPVGVAYGSDTDRARSLLLEVAQSTSLVLDDPAPSAIFRNFGESSLDFELRVFMSNRDLWPRLIDELHARIDAAFREAEIEIAFPQRDLHVRSAPGLRDFRGDDPEPAKEKPAKGDSPKKEKGEKRSP